MAATLVLSNVRIVGLTTPTGATPGGGEPVDLLIREGKVARIGYDLAREVNRTSLGAVGAFFGAIEEIDLDGRWVMPGFWDEHVHLAQWAGNLKRLDLFNTASPEDVLAAVAQRVQNRERKGKAGDTVIQGAGFRRGDWQREPTVAELDAVSGGHPVILVSMDCHSGWCNSAGLRLLGLPPRTGLLTENEWFAVLGRVESLPIGKRDALDLLDLGIDKAVKRGVVGVVDVGFAGPFRQWPERVRAGIDRLEVIAATYPEGLDEVIAAGLRTGDPLPDCEGVATMGPLKIITDGSLGTLTARSFTEYGPAGGEKTRGITNYNLTELTELMTTATNAGLECMVHAIGDEAIYHALTAFQRTGARGAMEHVQQPRPGDIAALGASGIRMSVQPAHLLDDRDLTAAVWADRAEQCFPLRSLAQAGADLRFGSDAPVAAIDPWRAISAAVLRTQDERGPWNEAECLDVRTSLLASVHGRGTITEGDPADLVVLNDDPLRYADAAAFAAAGVSGKEWFAKMKAVLTVRSGYVIYRNRRI